MRMIRLDKYDVFVQDMIRRGVRTPFPGLSASKRDPRILHLSCLPHLELEACASC